MSWNLDQTLARSAWYKLLSLAFLPPRAQESTDLLSGLLHVAPHLPERHRALLAPLLREGPALRARPTEREYERLFGVGRCAPPYETEYDPLASVRKGHVFADLLGFYRAFGLRLAPSSKEFPDHVAVELEFMSCLLLKAAHAAEQSLEEARAVSEDAAAKFLGDHLAAWGDVFADTVEATTREASLRVRARLLKNFLLAECELLGVTPTRSVGLPAEPGPLTCPFARGCPDILEGT